MPTASMAELIEASAIRNEALARIYRVMAKKVLSRPVASLAAASAGQHGEEVADLKALAASLDPALAALEAPFGPPPPPATVPPEADAGALLRLIRDEEEGDASFFARLAGVAEAALGASDLAAALHALSEEAGKRASMARDHLDLMAL